MTPKTLSWVVWFGIFGLGGCMDAVVPPSGYHPKAYQLTWSIERSADQVWDAVGSEIRAVPGAKVVLLDRNAGIVTWREPAPEKWTDIYGQAGYSQMEKGNAFYLSSIRIEPGTANSNLSIKKVIISEKSISVTGPQDGTAEAAFVDKLRTRLGLNTQPGTPSKPEAKP